MGWNSYLIIGAVLFTTAVNSKGDAGQSAPNHWREPWPDMPLDQFGFNSDVQTQQQTDGLWTAHDWLPRQVSPEGIGRANSVEPDTIFPTARWGYPGTIRSDHNITIDATGTETVLNLTDFILTGGTLTLEGTAAQSFVINVARQFSLSGDASIVLSGGILPENVTFNILGRGKDVVLRQSASLVGNIVAPYRGVILRGYATVFGTVDANWVNLKGLARIVPPPVVSP